LQVENLRYKLFAGGGAGAVIEEQAPFELLEGDGGGVLGAFWVFLHGFNQINESVGIPAAGHEAKQGFVGRERVQKLAGVVGQLLKNGVIGAAGVPIFAVGKVAFTAVHDGVPEAAGGGVERLGDGVRFIKPVVPEPQAGEQGAGIVGALDEAGELIGEAVRGIVFASALPSPRTGGDGMSMSRARTSGEGEGRRCGGR
jgi:hypothetical protein